MERDALDHILAETDDLIPSSGFLSAVMERVQDEAAAPPPIPFPWRRAIPGLIVVVGVLVWGVVELARYMGSAPWKLHTTAMPILTGATAVQHRDDIGWIALAAGVSLVSWWISRRIAGRSGLI